MGNMKRITPVLFLAGTLVALAEEHPHREIGFDHENGPYSAGSITSDFGNGGAPKGRDFVEVRDGVLRVAFKAGKKVSETGLGLQAKIPDAEACEVSFRIRYPMDFEAGLHGKQMGLSGGAGYDGGRGEEARTNGDGWSVRLQFDAMKDSVRNSLYVYHSRMPGKYGDSLKAGSYHLQRGRWHSIRLRATAQSTAGASDGRIEVWCDGEKKIDANGLRLVTKPEGLAINRVRAELFPGGGGIFPAKDYEIEVDDFAWATVIPERAAAPPSASTNAPAAPPP